MNRICLQPQGGSPLKVLCLGAHCDDIPLGCGGTVLHLAAEYQNLEVRWIVIASTSQRKNEETSAANAFLRDVSNKTIIVKEYRDGFLPYQGGELKEFFEELKASYSPDLILTHYKHDRHQDHRVISELTWNTWRSHVILEYEIPKYDGDMGSPNVLVPLTEQELQSKINILLCSFPSQRDKHWFAGDLFKGLARIRGMEAGGATLYAEGFYASKLCLR